MSSTLEIFSPAARAWFEGAFEAPTEVQEKGWRAVAAGRHTLMTAPTGSGKTLAAFFYALDRLAGGGGEGKVRVLYVSPLKALAVDVERNLRAPLHGIRQQAARMGLEPPEIAVAIRSGDTSSRERRQIERTPPDILITTPESLFLLLTSAARRILTGVETVIVDEIHSVASSKRGAHLALSLERLAAITQKDPQRIGLSATQRPLEEVGRFLGGPTREVEIVDVGRRKTLEITVEVPVEDMADLEKSAVQAGADEIVQRKSIWPAIHPRLLELIQRHRSTIVFVNSRRLAERLATRLNELAEADLVKAHHGSIAREQRMEIEDALKAGRLRGIVATSSLELGIDMGAVDLVIQVEAPPSVAAGMQRIGRSGHSIHEISRGTIFPKYRGDLLETAAVVEGMLAGDIEATRVLKNPIDVLAQHIVAMSALDEWTTDDLKALVRRTYSFESLGDRSFEAVLDMLAGRYPSDDFAELRPRIVWDRVNGTIRGRAGAQRLAVTNAGTIPDRGLYTVNLLEDGRRVGELDEEMVFESRPGETFVLGASTWRIADITPNQVLVVPAPGEPGKIAFWKADALARPVEVGRRLGRVTRELAAATPEVATARLLEHAGFDERAAGNLLAYLRDQVAATGALPDDRTIVVERFRDEVGDWRVCILTPYGGRVHAPWALALQWRLSEKLGLEVQSLYTDDGLALRFPDADEPVALEELMLDPEEVRELVTAQLPGSAMFASHFRESAARALLLPRRRPGQRTPLWQQRQRSASLLQVAGRFPDFPILAETFRECLSDEFDLEGLQELLARVRAREVRVVQADTDRASPFAGSLLFDYVGAFLYEGDAPLAERRAQALTLDRELLAELLGAEELRELLDPEAIEHTELELQGLLPERFPRDADEAHDLLARLGDLAAEEAAARGVSAEWLDELARQRRAVRARVGGEWRFFVAEDAGRYRDALAVAIPPGLPLSLLEPVEQALESLLRRYARTHVPFLARDPARRWKLPLAEVESALQRLVARGELLSGDFHPVGGRGVLPHSRGVPAGSRDPVGSSREFCHPDVLRTIRRRSLAALRRETEPVEPVVLARFLPQWHGVGAEARGLDRLLDVIFTLQGLALPASVIERDVLAARVRDYMPNQLDELISMGEVVWAGRGPLGTGDGRVALYLRGDAPRLLTLPEEPPREPTHVRLRERLGRGAAFFRDLYSAAGGGDEEAVLDALWDLVWAGEVTSDVFSPLRTLGPAHRRQGPGRRPRLPRLTHPRGAGRWSLVADLLGEPVSATERLHSEAGVLLQRHGVLTREAVTGEGWAGGFAALYPVLRAMEEAGKIRRGYFVQGLGGSQFALPGAVDRLRGAREPEGRILALAATDPANPYGTLLSWPPTPGRPARAAGAYVVVEDGELKLYLERGGRSLLTFGQVDVGHVVALVGALKKIKVELQRVDGIDVHGSALAPLLREAGFGSSPRGMVFWPKAPRSA